MHYMLLNYTKGTNMNRQQALILSNGMNYYAEDEGLRICC